MLHGISAEIHAKSEDHSHDQNEYSDRTQFSRVVAYVHPRNLTLRFKYSSVSGFALHLPLVFIHTDVGAPEDGTVIISHVFEAVRHAGGDRQSVNG